MQFENWIVTDTSIMWNGNGLNRFVIPINELGAKRHDLINNTTFYEWILIATSEDWLTQNDLFDLNYAIVYAFAKAGLEFDYKIFDETLEEQFEQFEDEDNNDYNL
jgi:nitric oxide synthase oxygenase domain/subunit